MQTRDLVDNLKKQRQVLEALIAKLKNSKSLSQTDLRLYDATSKWVEKNLRGMRRAAAEEMVKKGRLK